jgi:O-acetyl-ADP-ribose deacetylase (regulator of RNase III)
VKHLIITHGLSAFTAETNKLVINHGQRSRYKPKQIFLMSYKEIDGDLIVLAKEGMFDVIGHGCNCFCRMKRGIAPQMADAFGCSTFTMEASQYEGDINKLGTIDYRHYTHNAQGRLMPTSRNQFDLTVVNMYTQYHWKEPSRYNIPLHYDALALCLTKMNQLWPSRKIALPRIGCGLAGGDWKVVQAIIQTNLSDCDVTIVTKL